MHFILLVCRHGLLEEQGEATDETSQAGAVLYRYIYRQLYFVPIAMLDVSYGMAT